MIKMKLHPSWRDHVSHCQVTYYTKNEKNQHLIYCLQEHWPNQVRLLRCSQDGEPSHEVSFKTKVEFEKVPDDSRLALAVNKWIEENSH